jgi:hypothetical protein
MGLGRPMNGNVCRELGDANVILAET